MELNRRKLLALTGTGLLSGLVVACGEDKKPEEKTETAPAAGEDKKEEHEEDPNKKPGNEAQGLMVEGRFAKAAKKGEMTAAFGAFINHTEASVTITGAESPVAKMVELHDTVKTDGGMKMQKLEGGIEIPRMQAVKLHPGGKHIMLMGLNRDLNPGEEIAIRVNLSDGSSWEGNFPVRIIDNGKEEYGHEGHDHKEGHEGHDHKDK